MLLFLAQKSSSRDFPGGPVAKTDPCRHPSTGGPGSTPCQGTRSHMPQLRVRVPQRKIPHVTSKTQHSQINKLKKKSSSKAKVSMWSLEWSRMGTTSEQMPRPSPTLGGLRKGVVGQHGEGCPLQEVSSAACSSPSQSPQRGAEPPSPKESLGEESSGITHCHPLSCMPWPRQGAHPFTRLTPHSPCSPRTSATGGTPQSAHRAQRRGVLSRSARTARGG